MPLDVQRSVRAWDLVTTKKTMTNNPDWTAGVRMSCTRSGYYVVKGCRRFQGSPMEVKASLIQQTGIDGRDVTVRLA